ncbi:unnamed protein product, partial [Mesorhabditis spiculigera]
MEIGERYVEQMQTTIETMRRRCLAYYDMGGRVVGKVATAVDRLLEVAEPAYKDAQDYAIEAVRISDGPAKLSTDRRNTVVEIYLGLSVICIGTAAGQLAGASALTPLLTSIFHPFFELLTLGLIPLHGYITMKKATAMDDVERRAVVFQVGALMGILIGHLYPRVLSLVPGTFFLQPLLLGLFIDNELVKNPFAHDRHMTLALTGACSVALSVVLGCVPLGYFSLAVTLLAILHAVLISAHFQVSVQALTDNLYSLGDASLAYLLPLLGLQVLLAALFGSDQQAAQPIQQP